MQTEKKQRENEAKKKQIAEYKHKQAITADLLANADLDDYYDESVDGSKQLTSLESESRQSPSS